MTNGNQWTKIFTLLAAVVLLDDKVDGAELDCFTNAVNELTITLGFDGHVPAADIQNWFTRNEVALRELLASSSAEIRFTDMILSLAEFDYVSLVFEMMERISLSNTKVDKAEFDLVILASALWGLQPSRQFTAARPTAA